MKSHWPAQWRRTRLKHESSLKGRLGWQGLKADEYRDDGPHVVSSAHFYQDKVQWHLCPRVSTERYELDSNIQLSPNDILLMKDGAALGKLAYVESIPGPSCLNSHVLLLRPSRSAYAPRFFYYAATTPIFQDYMKVYGTGATFMGVSQRDIGNFPFALPRLAEQTQIARFLDYETSRIDALIDKQQQLIALLKEKRQAVISHAVTKGLNPDALMRDSGIEWLGEIPAHWTVARLKHHCDLQSGIPKGKPETSACVQLPMLRVANVQDGWLNLTDVHNISIERKQVARHLLRSGDVLMNEGGDRNKLGRGTIWRGEISPCIHQNHVFAIRPRTIEPEWLDAVARADYAKFHFFQVAKQSTNLASISSSNIKETPLVIPPTKERAEILARLKTSASNSDRLVSQCATQLDLLKERRTALISAAVTGKIDVRDWTPPRESETP